MSADFVTRDGGTSTSQGSSLFSALRKGDEVRATRDLYGPHRGEQRIIVGRGTRGVVTSGGDFYAFAQFGINEIEVFEGEVERV